MEKSTEKSSIPPAIYEPAILIDADGTLWPDLGPGSIFQKIDLVSLSSQIKDLCCVFSIDRVFVVSNQTCVARGLCTLDDLKKRISVLERFIRKSGVRFDFKYCVHHPEASDYHFRIQCVCRKPRPGIIRDISKSFSIDLKSSIFIGDRITDAQAASYSGIKQIFLIENVNLFKSNISSVNEENLYTPVSFRVIPSISYLISYIRRNGVLSI